MALRAALRVGPAAEVAAAVRRCGTAAAERAALAAVPRRVVEAEAAGAVRLGAVARPSPIRAAEGAEGAEAARRLPMGRLHGPAGVVAPTHAIAEAGVAWAGPEAEPLLAAEVAGRPSSPGARCCCSRAAARTASSRR